MKIIAVHAFGGPEAMALADAPTPRPGPGQALVAIKAAGVNPVDTYIRAGNYGPRSFPYTPGFDGAGVVEAAGAGVRAAVGARVYLDGSLTGTYATHALCEDAHLHPLPDRLTFAQGAALGVPYLTAARALFQKAMVKAGERVLVHGGSGGVGLAAIQLARAAGAVVTATAGSEAGRESCLRAGATAALDHRAADHLSNLPKEGMDVILEMASHMNLGGDLGALAKGGRVVVIGSRGPVEINPRDAMTREAIILGMSLFNCPPEERAALHERLAAGLADGSINPVVGREFPLADAPRAHEAVMAPGALGKIVLLP